MARRLARALALIPFAAVLLSIAACHSHHVEIAIRNQTGAAVQLLEVDYPSASFGADRLASGADFHYRIQVRGSGEIDISYSDTGDKQFHIKGPEIADHARGRLEIVLLPGGKAEFHPSYTGHE